MSRTSDLTIAFLTNFPHFGTFLVIGINAHSDLKNFLKTKASLSKYLLLTEVRGMNYVLQ